MKHSSKLMLSLFAVVALSLPHVAHAQCNAPGPLVAGTIDNASIAVSWTGSATATSYAVAIAGTTVVTTDTFHVFNGLAPNTVYAVSVRSICGVGDTSTAVSATYRTSCGLIDTLPFFCGFEDDNTGSSSSTTFAACWQRLLNATTYRYPFVSDNAARCHSGVHGLYWYSSSGGSATYGTYQIIILPPIDTTVVAANQTMLTFWLKESANNAAARTFKVGVMTDPTDINTFVEVATVSDNGTTWTMHEVSLSSYTGSGAYVAIRADRPTVNLNTYLDDVTLDWLPLCTSPLAFAVDSVSSTSISVSWTPTGSESSWLMYLGDSVVDVVSDTAYTFTGLDINTLYNVGVAAYCDNDDTSSRVSINVQTLLGDPISTFPYLCGFETIDECRDWVLVNGSQTNQWVVGSDAASTGSQALYITNDGSSNAYTITSTSSVFAYATFYLAAGEYVYSYDWRAYGESSNDYMRVAVVPDADNVVAGSFSGFNNTTGVPAGGSALDGPGRLNLHNTWQQASGTFNITTAGLYKVVFFWRNNASYGAQPPAAVDNFMMMPNTCPSPMGFYASYVGGDTIVLAWSAGGTETTWLFSDATGDYVVGSTSRTIIGVQPNTAYTYSVRAICGNDDTSLAQTITVRSACSDMQLPYFEDFETYTSATGATGVHVNCWDYVMTGGTGYSTSTYQPQVYGSSYNANSGTYSLRLYGLSYTSMPRLDDAYTANQVTVAFRSMALNMSHGLLFGVMSDPDDPNTFDTIDDVSLNYGSLTPYYHEYNMSNYSGTGRYFAFRNYNSTTGNSTTDIYIDDVEVWYNSSCPTPGNIVAGGATNSSVVLTWDDGGNTYPGMTLYWGTASTMAAATDSVAVTGNSYTLTGLTGNTAYNVWLVGNCTAEPSRAVTTAFTTLPDCMPVSDISATAGYTTIGLNWSAPTVCLPATEYIVSWKASSSSAWTSDTVNDTYYRIDSLTPGTAYDYHVVSVCNEYVSAFNSGSISTMACGTLVNDGDITDNSLPTYTYYEYSYTQQLYMAYELEDIDTITTVRFYATDAIGSRNVVLYMGNTEKSDFSSTADYVAASAMTQVGSATISGSGWVTVNLSVPFVREADSNLVVALDDNTGTYTVSAVPWAAAVTETPRAVYYAQDDVDISPALPAATNSGVLNRVSQIQFAGPNCVIPACPQPVVFVEGATESSVTVSWDVASGSTYEVSYRRMGDNVWTVADAANTLGHATITGLPASTQLYVRVSVDCGGTMLRGSVSAATLCGPTALPLVEDFQSCTQNAVYNRYCWYSGTTSLGTTYPYPIVGTLGGDADNALLLYNGAYLVLPELDAPLDALQISFTLTQDAANVRLLMGLLPDADAAVGTMYVLDTIVRSALDAANSSTTYVYTFDGLDTTYNNYRIVLWDAFNDNTTFIDNLVVDYVPPCAVPTGLSATAATTTATVAWTADTAASYIVEYGPRFFTPGTGTMTPAATSPASLTGLDHSTSYDAYVYTVCASGDISSPSQVVHFTTDCAAVTVLPYTVDFEGILAPGEVSANAQPNCWVATASGGMQGHVVSATSSSQVGSLSHCYFLYDEGVVALPQMGVPLDSLMLSFRDYNTDSSTYGLVIGAVDNTATGFAASFQPIDTVVFANGNNNVYNVVCYLNGYSGTATHIALKNYSTDSDDPYSVHYIDDLVVDRAPACIPPQRLRVTAVFDSSATIAWSTSNAPSLTVLYGVHGTAAYSSVTVATNSATLTGLMPNTQYDVYVFANCGGDTVGISFTTTCSPVTLPYFENFDNITTSTTAATGAYPSCWSYTLTGTPAYQTDNYVPQVYYNATCAHSGSYSMRLYGEGYHMLPTMPTSLDSLQLVFWNYTTGAFFGLEVGVMEGSTFVPVSTIQNVTNVNVRFEVPFDTYHGTSRTMAFRNYYSLDGSYIHYAYNYIDDIEVSYLPNCRHVTDVVSPAATTSSITVDWTDNSPTLQWQIEYGPTGYAQGSAAGTVVTVASHPAVIAGLDTLSLYDVYVRNICSTGDTGDWSTVATFSTTMCDNAQYAATGEQTGTTFYAPVNNANCYTLSETIIDSAELAGIGEIGMVGYYYTHTTPMSQKNNVTIWLQPTTKTVFGSINDMVAIDTATAVQVYTGTLNCSQGWNYFMFDNAYVWDGHSNLLVIVDDNSGARNSNSYTFGASSCSGYKTIYFYSNTDNPDPVKDQTDFLAQLYGWQLEKALFPIGHLMKDDVRRIAVEEHLVNARRRDSQGICFLGKIDYAEYLRRYLGEKAGDVVEMDTGRIIGRHRGHWFYTIGQRKGLGFGGGPWFVVKKDVADNTLYVSNGYDPATAYRRDFTVCDFHSINGVLPPEDVTFKIRHTPEFHRARLEQVGDGGMGTEYTVHSDTPIHGVAPGQFCVVYDSACHRCYGSAEISI